MSLKGTIVALACAALIAARASAAADTGELARLEVERAEQAVQAAAEKQALWTTARDALDGARAALRAGDYAEAVRAARFAAEQAQLGIGQIDYPRFP